MTFMDVDRFSVRCFTALYRLAAATYSKGVEAMASHPAAEHPAKAAEAPQGSGQAPRVGR